MSFGAPRSSKATALPLATHASSSVGYRGLRPETSNLPLFQRPQGRRERPLLFPVLRPSSGSICNGTAPAGVTGVIRLDHGRRRHAPPVSPMESLRTSRDARPTA